MQQLAKIFDSSARVKIMRLFLFNDKAPFDIQDIAKRSKVSVPTARKEVKILGDVGFLKKKTFTKEVKLTPKSKTSKTTKKNTKTSTSAKKTAQKIQKKKVQGWALNNGFPLADPLKKLLVDSELVKTKELPKRFEAAGKIKMLVLSGIFMKDDERSVDMVVVGDKIDMRKLQKTMQTIESEVGKELRYSVFTPKEFQYRIEMYDQHLLDIFEYPHERVVDKLKLLP